MCEIVMIFKDDVNRNKNLSELKSSTSSISDYQHQVVSNFTE